MTKRIFATVLALILCFTTLAIPTFAASAGSTTLTQTTGTNDVVASWPNIPGAAIYEAKLYLGGSQVGGTHTVTSTGVANYNCKWTVSAAGTYTVQIIGKASTAGMQVGDTLTATCNVTTSVKAGEFVFTKTGNTVSVDWSNWTVPAGVTVTNYNVIYTITGKTAITKNKIGNVTNYTIPEEVKATEGVTVTVQYCTAASDNAGNVGTNTLTASGTGATGGSTSTNPSYSGAGVVTYGNATVVGREITFTPIAGYSYFVSIYMAGASTPTYKDVAISGNTITAPDGATKVVISYKIANYAQFPTTEYVVVDFTGTSSSGSIYVISGTRTVTWNAVSGATYYNIYINGQSNPFTTQYGTSFNAQNGIWQVRVDAVVNSTATTVGTVQLPTTGNSTGTGSTITGNNTNYFTSGNLTISKGSTYTVVSWSGSSTSSYLVTYKNMITGASETRFVTGSSIQLPFSYSDTWTVTVMQYPGNTQIGSTTVFPTGSTGTSNTSVTTQGDNCIVTSTLSSATVTWNAVSGASTYTVLYSVDGSTKTTTTTSTSITLPVGHANAFDVLILSGSNVVARASVKQNLSTDSSTGTTPPADAVTKIDGLKLESTSWTTKISWDKVSGASYYYIMYGLYGSLSGEDTSTTKTYVEIPFGASKNFTVTVFAAMSNGSITTVGEAVYIAGSDADSDDFKVDEDAKPYVTNFKGTQGNNKIKLTYDAADDCDKYDIYYKKSSSDTWKKVASTAKLAVNISGSAIKNGTSYDFKIVANGNESGILTISPSATSTKVVVADDPEGAETVTENPVIKSAEGGNGTATIKWSAVEDAEEYKVYFATQGSNKYSSKATVEGTAVTIKGLEEGTYKVRIKALVDGEWTELADCDYVTVTVK